MLMPYGLTSSSIGITGLDVVLTSVMVINLIKTNLLKIFINFYLWYI